MLFRKPQDGDTVTYVAEFEGKSITFAVDLQSDKWGIAWYHALPENANPLQLPDESITVVLGTVRYTVDGDPLVEDLVHIYETIRDMLGGAHATEKSG